MNRRSSSRLQLGRRDTGLPFFICACFETFDRHTRVVEESIDGALRMLQDFPTPTLSAPDGCVLETERLTLRRPTLADVKAITHLANDRRIAENTRRLPHPYGQDHAVAFVRAMADGAHEAAFLIEHNHAPNVMVGINWGTKDAPELGYWLGVSYWGQGFATEAARAVIDFFFEESCAEQLYAGARVANPASRNILEKCGFQWNGVELHRFEA